MKMVLRTGLHPGDSADSTEASYSSINQRVTHCLISSGDAQALQQEQWHIWDVDFLLRKPAQFHRLHSNCKFSSITLSPLLYQRMASFAFLKTNVLFRNFPNLCWGSHELGPSVVSRKASSRPVCKGCGLGLMRKALELPQSQPHAVPTAEAPTYSHPCAPISHYPALGRDLTPCI